MRKFRKFMTFEEEFEKRKSQMKKLSDITKSGDLSDFLIVLCNYFRYGSDNIQEIKFDRNKNRIFIKWKWSDQEWCEYIPDEIWNENNF